MYIVLWKSFDGFRGGFHGFSCFLAKIGSELDDTTPVTSSDASCFSVTNGQFKCSTEYAELYKVSTIKINTLH